MAQGYISQVSEEMEGMITKKHSKEFSRTASRILGALSELDEFLLNPQFRTCSAAVPGTFANKNSENRETTGDRSLGDPCPEMMFSACHSSILKDSEQEEIPHSCLVFCGRPTTNCYQSTRLSIVTPASIRKKASLEQAQPLKYSSSSLQLSQN